MAGAILCHKLTSHLSLSGAIVGMVGYLCYQLHCVLSHAEGSLGQLECLLWPVNSRYPHSKNGLRCVLRPSLRLTSRLYSEELEKKKFDPENLKKKRVTFFCNRTWSQYKLRNQEKWLPHGPLNYSTILQLDLFWCSLCSKLYGTRSDSRSKGLTLHGSLCCYPIPSFPSVSPSTRSPGPGLFPIIKSLEKLS